MKILPTTSKKSTASIPLLPPPLPPPMHPSTLTPSPNVAAQLFIVGATIGPLVDSLHNQCLLTYDRAPIAITSFHLPFTAATTTATTAMNTNPLLCSSWFIPPLLGIAYIILGGILPRLLLRITNTTTDPPSSSSITTTTTTTTATTTTNNLRWKAILAVTSTAIIIKLSEYLQTHPDILILGNVDIPIIDNNPTTNPIITNLIIMTIASIMQWSLLDGSIVAFIAALLAAIGGPLSELPFVANGFWHYIPEASDYLPLSSESSLGLFVDKYIIHYPIGAFVVDTLLGGGSAGSGSGSGEGYNELAISSITGPCYAAVTMDAIAFGRWFDALEVEKQEITE